MYHYTWIQWLFFFFFYCFFGWCFESTVVSVQKRKFVNRGFIRGPFLPLYGTGALMMLVVSMPFQDNLVLTYLAGCVGATVLEYVTGVLMESLFKVRYWDYSNQKFNFQGQICLSSTLAWGGLTILMTHVVHKPVEQLAFWLPEWLLTLVTMVVTVLFVADFALSFKAALDLRDLLVKMEQARLEMERMQKRLDVLIAVADETVGNLKKESTERLSESREQFTERKEQLTQRWEELVDGVETRFVRIREKLPASQALLDKREELLELRSRFKIDTERRELSHFVSDMFRRNMIKGNPNMVSGRFAEGLEELKRTAAAYRKKKKDEK